MGHMVLLGAGASFGNSSFTPNPELPPLGDTLFIELDKLGRVASHFSDDLKDIFKENFETGMAEYFRRENGNIMSFQRELAGYLAKFTPSDDNNYIRLIRGLNNRRVIYSSLNYDLLFELSAAKLNLHTTYSNQYIAGHVRILKIHGSSNFWPNLNGAKIQGCRFYSTDSTSIVAPVELLNQEDTLNRLRLEDSVAPAIAMYAEGKAVKVSPNYVTNQLEMWNASINSSSKIFIIGVKVHPADEHIWQKIGESKADVFYFGFESDEQEFIKWKQASGKGNAYFMNSNFSNAVDIIKRLAK